MELKIPPAAVLAVAALLMWLAGKTLPAAFLPQLPPGALLLFAAGFGVIAAGVAAFKRARTTVNPLAPEQSSGIVSDGIYRFSRNPMYLGMALMLAGWAMWLGHIAAWLGVAGFAAYIHRFQILPEERILSEKFGEQYRSYCRKVRRWL